MSCLHLAAVFFSSSFLLPPSSFFDGWPEFRGPTGQGIYTGRPLPVEWGPDRNLAWNQTIPGKGWSSPILQDGRLYLTTAVPGTGAGAQSLQVLAVDAESGKILWQTEVFQQDASAPKIHSKNSHASPTPIADGQHIYAHFGHEGTACLDKTGKVLWRNRDYRYAPAHGNGGSPILANDLLVFSCDGLDLQSTIALDRQTGKQIWKTDRQSSAVKKFSFCTPLLIDGNGQQQILSIGSELLQSLDPMSGNEIWRVRFEGYSVVPRPVYGRGLIIFSTGFDSPKLLAIRPNGRGDVTETHTAWELRRGVPLNPSPLVVGEEVYLIADGGIASCLDAKTGKVHWQERVGGKYSASPLFADGKIYLQDEEGMGIVLQAGKTFKVLARNAMKEPSLASCAAGDGALFLRTEKHLYRIQNR